ncbi:MaoC/PaaZ C-terminal domain-containing protein [Alteromonas sp. M12]|uniref:MaoC/PaaZ C-terminal domain-containing protein n=1 Tax=Alteromonas sp. M12 TaxID=3135644 RepID=UPI00319DA3A4
MENKTVYWENFIENEVFEFGDCKVTENEIIDFAQKYDPLPHHIDPIHAQKSPLGVFCASGLHTTAMAHKLICDNLFCRSKLVAGRGVDKINMYAPVVPNDKLKVNLFVRKTFPHRLKKDRGWVSFSVEVYRGEAEMVLSFETTILFLKKPSSC